MLLIIDNYDSFTFNLVHYCQSLGATTEVHRNDAMDCESLLALEPRAILISPGPGRPEDAGVTPALIQSALARAIPLLGVCLGMQALVSVLGGEIVHAHAPMHGKTSRITHAGEGLFAGLPSPLTVARYHSLVAAPTALPQPLTVTARSTDDDSIMALAHCHLPAYGVQFHPESVATDHGHALLANFLTSAGIRAQTHKPHEIAWRTRIADARKSDDSDAVAIGEAV